MKKKILITGSSGMLGKDIVWQFLKSGGSKVFGISKDSVKDIKNFSGDLLDPDFIRSVLSEVNPDMIVHCAANVSIEDCEQNKEQAYALHVKSTEYLASYNPDKTRFVYISTDAVYDGQRGNYSETDKPAPVNYYAKTKLEGEEAAISKNSNTLVLRTNIYGINSYRKKSLAEWAIQNLSDGKKINGFTDVYFNPVYTGQLAMIIQKLIGLEAAGRFNVGAADSINKYDFLVKIADVFNFDKSLIGKASLDSADMVKRPRNTVMKTDKLKSFLSSVPAISEGIKMMKIDFDAIKQRGGG